MSNGHTSSKPLDPSRRAILGDAVARVGESRVLEWIAPLSRTSFHRGLAGLGLYPATLDMLERRVDEIAKKLQYSRALDKAIIPAGCRAGEALAPAAE